MAVQLVEQEQAPLSSSNKKESSGITLMKEWVEGKRGRGDVGSGGRGGE
jgi:hypothetical protein